MSVAPTEWALCLRLDDRYAFCCEGDRGSFVVFVERSTTTISATSPEDEAPNIIRQLMDGRNRDENFRRLFERYHHAVSSFFFRKGFSPEDSRDLTQEAFVAAYQGIRNLQKEEAFLSWLFSIASHVALRHWERQRTQPKLHLVFDAESEGDDESAVEQVAAPGPDPESNVIDSEKMRAMQEAMEELPSQMKRCLKGRIYEGLTNIEIARRLGISESTVAVHVHRGIAALKTRLYRYFERQPATEEL